jgi:hypothetical protein
MVNHTRKYNDDQLARMRSLWESYVSTWVIAQEFGFKDKALRSFASSHGWKRPADFRKKLDEANTYHLPEKKELYLRKAWHDGTLMVEMEVELGVCACTVRRLAKSLDLGPRNKQAVEETCRELQGHKTRAKTIQRLWNNSDMTPEEISAEVGMTRGSLIQLVRRRRKNGEEFRTLMPRYVVTGEDRATLRDGYRFGLGLEIIGRLLSNQTRLIHPSCVDVWGHAMQLQHRNHWPQMLRQLSPELLWAFREYSGDDPCVLVQKAYTISNQMSLLLAQRCIVDYHKALVRFPQIPELMAGVKKVFWWRDIKPVRPPHPIIDRMRTQHARRKAA